MGPQTGMKKLGYQQVTSLSSAAALTIPLGTSLLVAVPETQAVRWRDDGTDPTASVGMPLGVGDALIYDSSFPTGLKFIEQTASAKLNVSYYGPT